MTKLTAEERSQRARLAAQVRWSRQDPVVGTEPARRAFVERFVDEVDPERTLPEAERARRAESARKAFYRGSHFAVPGPGGVALRATRHERPQTRRRPGENRGGRTALTRSSRLTVAL